MKVTELIIKRQESYEADAGQFRGLVTLLGEEGKQSLTLSNGSIAAIFGIIKDDAIAKAKSQAKAAGSAIQDASDEFLLLEEAK